MSYARFGWNSDVYVIATTCDDQETIQCVGCKLIAPENMLLYNPVTDPWFTTASGVLWHMDEHKAAGQQVPDHVYERVVYGDSLGNEAWLPAF